MIERLFVYGTLRPAESRWPAIEPFVARVESATLHGYRMYALPEGYPGIEAGDGEVVGTLLRMKPARLQAALARVDQIEGYVAADPQSLYERVVVEVSGEEAYTYIYHPNRREYLRSHGRLIESGDWLAASKNRASNNPPGES